MYCVNVVYVNRHTCTSSETNFILNLADSWHAKSNISSVFDYLKNVICDIITTIP